MKNELFDAIAVNHKTGSVRIFGAGKTLENAEAISKMAVMRRGCDEEFFTEVAAGTYKDFDLYRGDSGTFPDPENLK